MKLDARDILEVLRLFGIAGAENVPRHVERIHMSHPDELSTIYDLMFQRLRYMVVLDSELDDSPDMVLQAVSMVDANTAYEVVACINDETADYATRFHGKVIYLVREIVTAKRLDAFLAETRPEYSRSTWQKLIKNGAVSVNGAVEESPKRQIEPATDTVESNGIEQPDFSDDTLPIIYEDDNVIVANKPVGVLTHSKGALNDEFTVAEFFRGFTTNGLDTNRPGIIHRLDRDTSGVIIGARNDETALKLKKQFSERTVKKTYVAIVTKAPELPTGIIDIPIGRNPSAPSTFRADTNGKSAQTHYDVLSVADDGAALIRLQPRTGRTHQLRVHLAHLGCPIVGDRVYGKESDRLMLHAYQLEITIPVGQREVFTAPIPAEFFRNFPDVTL